MILVKKRVINDYGCLFILIAKQNIIHEICTLRFARCYIKQNF